MADDRTVGSSHRSAGGVADAVRRDGWRTRWRDGMRPMAVPRRPGRSRVGRGALVRWLGGVAIGAAAVGLGDSIGLGAPAEGLSPGAPAASEQASGWAPEVRAAAEGAPRAATGGPGALASRTDPVASYTIDATLDPVEHTIEATETVRWTNRSRVAVGELYWHLYLNAFESDRTLYALDDIGDGFRGGSHPDTAGSVELRRMVWREQNADLLPSAAEHTAGHPDDRTEIRVGLPASVEPGQSATFELTWSARLPALVMRTGYVGRFHMVGQWFPKLARLEPDGTWRSFPFRRLSEFYADFGDYDVTIELPTGYEVAATGTLVARDQTDDRARWHFVQPSVHDFAFAAGDEMTMATKRSDAGVEIRCLYPRGLEWAAHEQLDAASFGLGHFSALYGEYPYETLTLVHPPDDAFEAGGMEYPTLITTGAFWVYQRLGAHTLDQVTLHELAHQWFYGLVATDEHRFPFLDEGLTSYAEAEVLEARYPGASALSVAGFDVALPALVRAWSKRAWSRDVVVKGAAEFERGSDYGGLVYGKPATILQTLARIWGRDAVVRALGHYARRYRFAHPGPAELVEVFREQMGDSAAAALHAGLYQKGSVDFSVGPIAVSGGRATVTVNRNGPMVLPVEIELWRTDGRRELRTWDGQGESTSWEVPDASTLVGARVDPHRRILVDPDWSNNAMRVAHGPSWTAFAPRVLDQIGYGAAVLLTVAGP